MYGIHCMRQFLQIYDLYIEYSNIPYYYLKQIYQHANEHWFSWKVQCHSSISNIQDLWVKTHTKRIFSHIVLRNISNALEDLIYCNIRKQK